MAPYVRSPSESSDTSLISSKTAIQNTSSDSTVAAKEDSPLPSTSDPQSPPYGKTHGGELSRRGNRRANPLPAPMPGQSNTRGSANTFCRNRRRANRPDNGGHNSDSDSDDDRKRRRQNSGDDDDASSIKRGKRPASPPPHAAEAPINPPVIDPDEEERVHRAMQQTLTIANEVLAEYLSPSMQRLQMSKLFRELPPDSRRRGAIQSEKYDLMLECLDEMRYRSIRSDTEALMRQQTSLLSETTSGNYWVQREFSEMIRSGKVTFKFVHLPQVPPCIVDLPSFHLSKLHRIRGVMLRVLVKENTPRFAEVVSPSLLLDLGWWHCSKSRTWCHNQVDGNKFSGSIIYRLDITGKPLMVVGDAEIAEDPCLEEFRRLRELEKLTGVTLPWDGARAQMSGVHIGSLRVGI